MKGLFWAGFWSFLADQASKYAILYILSLQEVRHIAVLPPLLNFHYGENRGINFGLFGNAPDMMRWVLIAFSLIVVAGVLYWVRRTATKDWRVAVSAGFLVGGALGNVVDRLIYGYVVDFINTSCCGIDNPFVFNIADVFIFLGALGIILLDRSHEVKKHS